MHSLTVTVKLCGILYGDYTAAFFLYYNFCILCIPCFSSKVIILCVLNRFFLVVCVCLSGSINLYI